jgi:mRNA interferase MazF
MGEESFHISFRICRLMIQNENPCFCGINKEISATIRTQQCERNEQRVSVKRGDIYYADLSPVIGSEQGGTRPVLIIQNEVGNKFSPTVIAAAITSRTDKSKLPTHIDVFAEKYGLAKDSVILLEQIRTIDKKRLKEKMGHLDDDVMNRVNNAITVSFGLEEPVPRQQFIG